MYITIIYRNRQKGDFYEPGFIITEHTESGDVVANLPYWYADVRCDTAEESRYVAHFLARTEIARRYPVGITVMEQGGEAVIREQGSVPADYSYKAPLTKNDLLMIFGPIFLHNTNQIIRTPSDKLFTRTVKRILKHEIRHAENIRKAEINAEKEKIKDKGRYFTLMY